ncbi:hypothetical protein BLNAU_7406 [Blattamonas nauphoetae]|uniref:Cyclin N-terminal domain-containing protein n=1 Tax=Blattamonas nauphoetae TaxID=2049346 RepID=A0ABQ9Y190_9EUKA|nr:hypothetical protein BLNAU_7406 [Blattamonas nauphoetae]
MLSQKSHPVQSSDNRCSRHKLLVNTKTMNETLTQRFDSLRSSLSSTVAGWIVYLFTTQNVPLSQSTASVTRDSLKKAINAFFINCSTTGQLTEVELLYSACIIQRVIRNQLKGQTPSSRIITQNNLGTLLLCSIIVTLKLLRDNPYTNSCWAKYLRIPLSDLNHSEVIMLAHLNFNLNVQFEEISQLYSILALPC